MLMIDCPYCGARPELEFRYAGEAHVARPADPAAHSDAAWAEHLFYRANAFGEHAERWRHIHGCGRFFNALRDTRSDLIRCVYPTGEARPSPYAGSGATPRGGCE